MKVIEKQPLPNECVDCRIAKEGREQGLSEDAYCYNCDYALNRWEIIIDKS